MKKIQISTIMHIVLLAAIVIIIAAAGINLYLWNKSSSDIPEEYFDTGEFDSEPEDYYVTTDTSLLEGYTEDGVTTVVMLGDGLLGDYRDNTGIASMLEDSTGATVYNCGFSNMSMSAQYDSYDGTHGDDAFSFYYVAMCIANNTYDLLKDGLETAEHAEDYFADTIAQLESIDFSRVDIITISYGYEDYLKGRPIEYLEEQEAYQSTVFTDALKQGIEWIRLTYPQIQFIVMSPTFCRYVEADGSLSDCDVRETGDNGTMANYMIAEKNAAVSQNVTFLDNYWGININAENADDYLTDSTTFPNEAGRKLIAQKLATTIKEKIYYTGK